MLAIGTLMQRSEGYRAGAVGLALASVYILWGSTYLAIRISLESIPPFFMAGFRFFVTGTLLYLFLRLRGAKAPGVDEFKGAGIVGLLLLLVGNGGVVYAEQWVSSSVAALGVATVPLWTVVFGRIWKKVPTPLEWFAVLLGLIGVILLNLEGDLKAHPLGALALAVAALSWALGSAWSTSLRLPSGLMAAAVEMMFGGYALLVLSLAAGETVTGVPTARSIAALAYLMVFGALIGFTAYTYLVNNVRATLATSYAYVNPVIAVGLGVGLAGERLTGAGFLAMPVIVMAVIIILYAGRKA